MTTSQPDSASPARVPDWEALLEQARAGAPRETFRPYMVELATRETLQNQTRLRLLGNAVARDAANADAVLDAGLLPELLVPEQLQMGVVFNLTVGNPRTRQALLDNLPRLAGAVQGQPALGLDILGAMSTDEPLPGAAVLELVRHGVLDVLLADPRLERDPLLLDNFDVLYAAAERAYETGSRPVPIRVLGNVTSHEEFGLEHARKVKGAQARSVLLPLVLGNASSRAAAVPEVQAAFPDALESAVALIVEERVRIGEAVAAGRRVRIEKDALRDDGGEPGGASEDHGNLDEEDEEDKFSDGEVEEDSGESDGEESDFAEDELDEDALAEMAALSGADVYTSYDLLAGFFIRNMVRDAALAQRAWGWGGEALAGTFLEHRAYHELGLQVAGNLAAHVAAPALVRGLVAHEARPDTWRALAVALNQAVEGLVRHGAGLPDFAELLQALAEKVGALTAQLPTAEAVLPLWIKATKALALAASHGVAVAETDDVVRRAPPDEAVQANIAVLRDLHGSG